MKTLAPTALLLLACVLTADAQQPRIIEFDHEGAIAWTNSMDPAYCGLEAKWDLSHTWLPLLWNLPTTGAVYRTGIDMDMLRAVACNIGAIFGQEPPCGFFFRVVASDMPLGPRFATNFVFVGNASSAMLSNVEIGRTEGWNRVPITNAALLAQGALLPRIAVAQRIDAPNLGTVTNIVAVLQRPDGWYVSYDQDGTNRLAESMVVPFGPPEKNVCVTVNDDSVTVDMGWLGFRTTEPY